MYIVAYLHIIPSVLFGHKNAALTDVALPMPPPIRTPLDVEYVLEDSVMISLTNMVGDNQPALQTHSHMSE